MKLNLHTQLINNLNVMKVRNYYHIENEDRTNLTSFYFDFYPKYESDDILKSTKKNKIKVPSNWQMLGYDKHQYTNIRYPFPYDPPYIDADNPCGVYMTTYKVDNKDKRHYLNIDGADSCVYVLVNGELVGYDTVSHSPSEFDITDNLKIGTNNITLVVFKWNANSYLEDQDKFRMSGLFRDVYITRRLEDHIHDYKLDTDIVDNVGILTFKCDKKAAVTFNNVTKVGTDLTFKIKNVHKWNAEDPFLYDLKIQYNFETITDQVGFRKVTIDGNVFKLNGMPIKFKGVNRHSSTINGYVETIKDLENDLKLLKKYNVNAIRTSHYPPHKELPYLCDKYGIYLLEEADVECHGVWYKSGLSVYNDYNYLASTPMFHNSIVYRQEKMVLRDLNRPSILIWSLGNESGWGQNFIDASKKVRELDPTRPIHYERSFVDTTSKEPKYFDFAVDAKPYIDIYSRMYPTYQEMEKMKGRLDKPFILCEYSHAMGNSCGDIDDYEKIIDSDVGFCGGFIWEMINHSIIDGNKMLYGGDFGEIIHDNNFCMDGLVGIDRSIFPEFEDVKNTFAPIRVIPVAKFEYKIINRRYFTNLSDIKAVYYFEYDGIKDKEIKIDVSKCKPQDSINITINSYKYQKGTITINFIFKKDDNVIYKYQNIIQEDKLSYQNKEIMIEKLKDSYKIGNFLINFDGFVKKIDNQYLKDNYLNVTRAYIDNDAIVNNEYFSKIMIDNATYRLSEVIENSFSLTFLGKIVTPIFKVADVAISYNLTNLGLKVKVEATLNPEVRYLLRFGMSYIFSDEYNKTTYFGYGPNESYIDKNQASTLSLYETTFKDNYFNYPKPQESGSHFETRFATIYKKDKEISFIGINPFSYQPIIYELGDFKDHAYKMENETNKRVVNIDMMSGVGSNSCGPELKDKYKVKKNIKLEYIIKAE